MSTTPGHSDLSDPLHNGGINYISPLHHDTYPYIDPTQYDLTGKSVLVTGASKGVGRAIAAGFAKAGASRIALAARSFISTTEVLEAADLAGRPEPQLLLLNIDITDRKSTEDAAKRFEQKFGGSLDILINNAGYLGRFEPILEGDPDDWWSNYEVNIKGLYLVTRAVLPMVLKSELKTIVNITSAGAHFAWKGASGYQSTKLAVLRLSEFLVADYGDQGLLSYSVHPGGVKTELAGNMPKFARERLLIDEPELPGNTIPWLSSQRREWLAGRYISSCWDMLAFEQKKDEIVKGDLLKVRMAVSLGS
ncbi:MAG: hypothetical protein M1820_006169 [Bogoriella megaspora]|nr:MAG: hypothetical protein M1820_006169 [Bogoriella megaspora]